VSEAVCVCGHARRYHLAIKTAPCAACKCRRFREQLSLIAELEALRRAAADRVSKAEYEFSKAERALGEAKKRERMKGVTK
jgi:hypothetical protein